MLGQLPKTLNVNGIDYEIRTDFRNILTIFEAFEDDDLTNEDKVYILLKRMYVAFDRLPRKSYTDAYKAAVDFIEGNGVKSEKKTPKLINWIKDESLIFPRSIRWPGAKSACANTCTGGHSWAILKQLTMKICGLLFL